MHQITIPSHLLPSDGRFGSGPSMVRSAQLEALTSGPAAGLMGTSHRKAPVKDLVGSIKNGLTDLFALPDGYQVVLGNGGASAMWDALTLSVIERRSFHAVSGVFGKKFAKAVAGAPFLEQPVVVQATPGERATPVADQSVDAYAWAHNETSTGVLTPVLRPAGASEQQLVLVDGTSAAAGAQFDASQADIYYFSPQKNFGADAGIWFALMSPAALARVERIAASARWIPEFLSLKTAVANSVKNQTLNTPALATLVMVENQISWLIENGGMVWADERCAQSSKTLYDWAESCPVVRPFVAETEARSPVVVCLEFDQAVSAPQLAQVLRDNGIVDVEPYRGIGANQLRVATFVSREPADVQKLTGCLDYAIDALIGQ
ncbi:MAG: phosphoserine transaminase [Micrococcales bacterium]|nr:phosphoserine transaminase [Micrococcales bacterium]